jgi:hypothetical protein
LHDGRSGQLVLAVGSLGRGFVAAGSGAWLGVLKEA